MSDKTLTPVLNSYDEELIFLDLNHPVVSSKASITHDDDLGMQVISNYRDIEDELDLGYADEDMIKAYFVERCNKASGYGTEFLDDQGYEYLYGMLKEASFTFKSLIKALPGVVTEWRQSSAEDVLDDLDVDHSEIAENDKLDHAVGAIHESDSMGYETTYTVEGKTLILHGIR